MENRPVMRLDRLGVHWVSMFMLRKRTPSLASESMRARCATGDAAAVGTEFAVAQVVHQDEEDVGLPGLRSGGKWSAKQR
jgi:hypothetical protein